MIVVMTDGGYSNDDDSDEECNPITTKTSRQLFQSVCTKSGKKKTKVLFLTSSGIPS